MACTGERAGVWTTRVRARLHKVAVKLQRAALVQFAQARSVWSGSDQAQGEGPLSHHVDAHVDAPAYRASKSDVMRFSGGHGRFLDLATIRH